MAGLVQAEVAGQHLVDGALLADDDLAKTRVALKELAARVDVIVLAQASMARVVDSLAPADSCVPILASPGLAIDYLATIL